MYRVCRGVVKLFLIDPCSVSSRSSDFLIIAIQTEAILQITNYVAYFTYNVSGIT